MGWLQRLGLQSVTRTITDHDARIVTPDPTNNPMQRFKASLPDGALDASVADWPREQLAGYLGAMCEYSRAAFQDRDDWVIRSVAALSNLLFDAHLPQMAVTYNLEGTREGVAREVGTFRLTAHHRQDLEQRQGTDDALPDTAIAADPQAQVPGPHLASVWADRGGVLALYDEVNAAFQAVPGQDPEATEHAVVKATAYLLVVLEHLSADHLATYHITAKGLSKNKESEVDEASALRRRSMAYVMDAERTEIALPAPTVATPRRSM